MKKKTLISIIAVALVLCVSVGGVLAWLTDSTASIKNTFTVGNINIDLSESDDLNLKMVPGATITKDPKVTVEANSEDCYLFVKVEKSANFDDFMTYVMADDWTALDGVPGVYYREVATSETDTDFAVLKDNTVIVKDTVTKEMMNAIQDGTANAPTLSFTAYAVQKSGSTTAADAWAKLPTTTTP